MQYNAIVSTAIYTLEMINGWQDTKLSDVVMNQYIKRIEQVEREVINAPLSQTDYLMIGMAALATFERIGGMDTNPSGLSDSVYGFAKACLRMVCGNEAFMERWLLQRAGNGGPCIANVRVDIPDIFGLRN